jgi:hypothetical protein
MAVHPWQNKMEQKEPRNVQLNFRCTAEEKKEMEAKAKDFGFHTLASFIIWCIKNIKKP